MTTQKESFAPCDLIIYGGLGDLSRRKLIISLYRLENGDFLEPDTRIIAVDRLDENSESFIKIAHKSLHEFLGAPVDEKIWKKFSARLSYQQMDLTQPEQYKVFNDITDSSKRVMVNYFAVAPFLFQHICQGLQHSGVLTDTSRMVMEKPIGHDLASSKEINDVVASVFNDVQVFRIDHYLGKETVLNLLALRFANSIFTESFKKLPANKLIIHLQPNEGIEIQMLNKIPGIDENIKLQKTKLDLSFSEAFKNSRIFGGYEKLILEAMRGNPTLFISREEIEQAWSWIDSIQDAWEATNEETKGYPAGSWGPVASISMLARDGRSWEE